MVLESLGQPRYLQKNPKELFFLSFSYTAIAILLSIWIFPEYGGLTMVFFSVMATIPLMLKMILMEEKKYMLNPCNERHVDALKFFIYLFIGMVSAYTLFFVMLPEEIVSKLFNIQLETITQINSDIASSLTGKYMGDLFSIILINNLKVMVFALLFSFIYGSGAIFILTWNASVISVTIGSLIRKLIYVAGSTTGAASVTGYFSAITTGLSRYLLHGIPEIGAYFVAGLAGGLISIGTIKYQMNDQNFSKLMKDVLFLIFVAILLIVFSAIIEVSISPLIA